ncbi:MAG: glycosyltransferase [Dongiaceae bacterium]
MGTEIIEREHGSGRRASPEGGAPDASTSIGALAAKAPRPVVLQVVPRLSGSGSNRDAIAVAAGLVSAGGSAIMASADPSAPHELTRLGIAHARLAFERDGPFVRRRVARAILALVGRHNPDILHIFSGVGTATAALSEKPSGCALVTNFQPDLAPAGRRGRRLGEAMLAGDRVVVESDFASDAAKAADPAVAGRLRLIPRGIDVARFDPARVGSDRLSQLARHWQLPDDERILMLPGPLDDGRGHRQFVELMTRFAGRDVRGLIVGDGPDHKDSLPALIRRLGLEGRVHVISNCRDMPAAYMLADVVVLPSTMPQSFDRVFAEAQAIGRPVVASNVGSIREQADRGAMAWLTPPDDADALHDAVHAALALTAAERERLAPKAIAGVRRYYSQAAAAVRMVDLYRELFASPQIATP